MTLNKLIMKIFMIVWRRFFKYQFMRFAFVGGTGAVIDFGLLALFTEVFGIFYLLSATISYIISNLYNFILSKQWTFRNTSNKAAWQYIVFFMVGMVGLGINNIILYLSVEHGSFHYLIGKIFAAAVVMVWNYVMNKYVTFRLIEKI